jgi:hypothetical protein
MPDCDPLDETIVGKNLIVTDEDNCPAALVAGPGCTYPATVQVHSPDHSSIVDGSEDFPFSLPNIQKQIGGSFSQMMIKNASGEWCLFEAPEDCMALRLVVIDGTFTLERDFLPAVLLSEICEVSACSEFDFLIGAVEDTIECEEGTVDILTFVKVPKSLCPVCGAGDSGFLELEQGGIHELEQGGNLEIE